MPPTVTANDAFQVAAIRKAASRAVAATQSWAGF